MNEYKIEYGVPIPKGKRGRKPIWRDLANKMQEGDSVLLPEEQNPKPLSFAIDRIGHVAVTRKMQDGTRVWKMERRGNRQKSG